MAVEGHSFDLHILHEDSLPGNEYRRCPGDMKDGSGGLMQGHCRFPAPKLRSASRVGPWIQPCGRTT